VLRFVTYFLRESVRGGIDVAGRVSARRLRVAPGLVRYRWRLPADGPARALFALSASLLPGTVVAAMGEHEVLIHALDAKGPVLSELAELEQRVAGLFALRLPAPEAIDA
jgi:multicomponent Na+:H+ antiporter subunit E